MTLERLPASRVSQFLGIVRTQLSAGVPVPSYISQSRPPVSYLLPDPSHCRARGQAEDIPAPPEQAEIICKTVLSLPAGCPYFCLQKPQ